MNNRFLFLDIDGVLNTHMIYREPIEGRRMIEKDGFYFELCWPSDKRVSNEFAVNWLSKLCLEYNLDIVITSTWLIGHSVEEIATCLYNSGLHKDVKVIDGCTTNQFKCRGVQIESWFDRHKLKIEDTISVILDDDTDMVGFRKDYTPYLIKCDTYTGFGMVEYSKACEFIERQLGDNNEED